MGDINDCHARSLGCTRFSIEYWGVVDESEVLVLVVVSHDVFLPVVCGWIGHLEVNVESGHTSPSTFICISEGASERDTRRAGS